MGRRHTGTRHGNVYRSVREKQGNVVYRQRVLQTVTSLRVVSLGFRGHDLRKIANINRQQEATLSLWKKLVPRERWKWSLRLTCVRSHTSHTSLRLTCVRSHTSHTSLRLTCVRSHTSHTSHTSLRLTCVRSHTSHTSREIRKATISEFSTFLKSRKSREQFLLRLTLFYPIYGQRLKFFNFYGYRLNFWPFYAYRLTPLRPSEMSSPTFSAGHF